MPLKFLKKLTEKLLGKKEPEKSAPRKAGTKKEPHGRQGASRGSHERPGPKQDAEGRGKGGWKPRSSQKGEAESRGHSQSRRGERPPSRRDGYPEQRGPRPDRPPRPARTETPISNEVQAPRRPDAPRPTERALPHSARSVARPGMDARRGHDRDPGERMNTAAGVQRPGGAIHESELEKRRSEHATWTLDQFQVPEAEGKKRFHDFDLPAEIMHAVADKNFQYCTPIQAMSLEHALAGKNVAGKAQTGTGKTAAFLVAILTRYLRSPEGRADKGGRPRALVIAPTRELVIQICKDADSLGKYCGLRSLAVYGGMDYERQKREVMDEPVDLLVATPGRLLDFVRSRVIDLSMVDTLVIDEADRMLDMGFIPDVRTIIRRLPPKEKRCTMLYSATLSDDVMNLAAQWMEEPVRVETETEQGATKTVKQIVYVVTSDEKFTVLYNHIQQFPDSRILVFCNRKTTTEDVADSLSRRGVRCETLSGDVNQNRRLRVLEDFRNGKIRIVVATDVAGRGIHVDDIGFVINFDFPYAPEDYVHRIGRTGRAGQSGVAISFADEDESFTIPEIEKYIGEELKCTLLKADDPLLAPIPKVTRRQSYGEERKSQENVEQQDEVTQGEDQAPASAFVQPPPAPIVQPPPAPIVAPVETVAPVAAPVVIPEKSQPAPVAPSQPRPPLPSKKEEAVSKPVPPPTRSGRFSDEWVPGGGN
jgi:ATP-dependent RNA helicase RhlB